MARRQLNKREKKLKEHEEIDIGEVEEAPQTKGFSFANFGAGGQQSDSSENDEQVVEEVKPVAKKKKKKKNKGAK